jgi:hypothetical protein
MRQFELVLPYAGRDRGEGRGVRVEEHFAGIAAKAVRNV